MLNLLIFTNNPGLALIISVILFFIIIIGLCRLGIYSCKFHYFDNHHCLYALSMFMIFWLIICDFAITGYNISYQIHTQDTLTKIDNYRHMNHMKYIYPRLPSHANRLNHNSKTLSSDVSKLRYHKHMLTKTKLRNYYYDDEKMYGSPHHIKTPVIHWWNYL